MVRSKSSNQRPDTLMQDRICQVDETSCNARPDHTYGSETVLTAQKRHFRSTPETGHRRLGRSCRFRASFGLMHRSKQLKLFDRFVGASEQEMRHCELAELARVTGVKLPESNFA
jgi:hypothetical protein